MATEEQQASAEQNGHTPEPVLDIKTLAPERERVRIDGELYDLAIMADFGIEEQQQMTRDGREFDTLWKASDELTPTDKQRLKQLLDRMFERVLLAPQTIKNKLNDDHRQQVVLAFTIAPLAKAAREEEEAEAAKEKGKEKIPTTEK